MGLPLQQVSHNQVSKTILGFFFFCSKLSMLPSPLVQSISQKPLQVLENIIWFWCPIIRVLNEAVLSENMVHILLW